MARYDLQGSLDLLVLKTLSQRGKLHGYGIVQHIQRASDELLRVEEGSLYPALHRMEQTSWIRSEWGGMRKPHRKMWRAWVSFFGVRGASSQLGRFEAVPGGRRCLRRGRPGGGIFRVISGQADIILNGYLFKYHLLKL